MTDYGFLTSFGWGPFFAAQLDEERDAGCLAARVITEERRRYRLQIGPEQTIWGEVSGRLMHEASGRADFPTVGDWVMVQPQSSEFAVIHRILDRKTKLGRKAAGEGLEEQLLATNVDTAFVVTSMNADFNVRRLERYLTLIRSGGASPVVLLTKADLADDQERYVQDAAEVAEDAPVFAISNVTKAGIGSLTPYLEVGTTSVLLGSSGVGKSTLINLLVGENLVKTGVIRDDDAKGRHTTTSRSLWRTASGALIIDTPGMRELQLFGDKNEGLEQTFDDVESIALTCKFTNCRHESEPGCKIRESLASGELAQERYNGYLKLKGEIAHQIRKTDKAAAAQQKDEWKKIHKDLRQRTKLKGKS